MSPEDIRKAAEDNPSLHFARTIMESRPTLGIVTIANELQLPVPEVAAAYGYTATKTGVTRNAEEGETQ